MRKKANKTREKALQTLSPTQLAQIFGVTRQTVHKLTKERVIRQIGPAEYGLDAVGDYTQHLRDAIEGAGAGRGLTAERAELVRERIKIARLERQRREGNWIPRIEARDAWAASCANIRTRMLSIPSRIAARWSLIRSPVDAEQIIMEEVRVPALSELADEPVVADLDDELRKQAQDEPEDVDALPE